MQLTSRILRKLISEELTLVRRSRRRHLREMAENNMAELIRAYGILTRQAGKGDTTVELGDFLEHFRGGSVTADILDADAPELEQVVLGVFGISGVPAGIAHPDAGAASAESMAAYDKFIMMLEAFLRNRNVLDEFELNP